MARIRTIKPEFWADEKLSAFDPVTRLVFLGLISLADDAGRLVDNLKQLDGQIFPSTDDTCKSALETLANASRILRYRSDSGQDLIQITRWAKHQRVDKPNKHVLPGPPKHPKPQPETGHEDRPPFANDSGEPRESVATPSRDPRAPTLDHGPTTMDQRPTTNDHGPSTADRSRADLRESLTSDDDRAALDRILAHVANPATWIAEMQASLAGMGGHVPVTALQLGRALRDYVGNGDLKHGKLIQFRRYLETAAKDEGTTPRRASSKQERGRENLNAALERRERERGH